MSRPKRAQNPVPRHWTATFRPLLRLRMRHKCRASSRVFGFYFLRSPSAFPQTSFRTSRLWQKPPITNVLLQDTPLPSSPSGNRSWISRTPLLPYARCALTSACDAVVARAPTPARAAPADRWAARRSPALRASHCSSPTLPPSVPAAATHVGVRAPAVAAAAAPAAAARTRNRRLTLSGRNHELGRRRLCAVLPHGRGAPTPVPASVRGAGSRPAAQQRGAPAGVGGGTGAAGSLWGPGEGGAAAAAPASRCLFPRGRAGNLGPAWAPVPSLRVCEFPRFSPRRGTAAPALALALPLLRGSRSRCVRAPHPLLL